MPRPQHQPELRRQPPGRRFVLHRTSGPRPQVCRPILCPPRPLERGLLLLLHTSTRPPRALPQPPSPPQPWPPSGVHFHPSDPPFGPSCLVSALSCVPSARPGIAARPTAAGARAAARAAVAAGAMAAACAQAPPPVWPPEQPVAAAHAPVRASPAAVCSRSRAAAGAAAEAAAGSRRCLWRPAEAATRRAQLGSCWSRPDASWGGVGRVFGGRFGAMPVFMEKSWDRVMLFCRVMLVSMRGMCAFLMLRTLVYTSVCRTRVWRCSQEIT